MFQSERFFREAWPTISQAVESAEDAASAVRWIMSRVGVKAGARVLDAPCGFGRHAIEFARKGCVVTGVDFNETELARARAAAGAAGLPVTFVGQDMRDMEFAGEFSSIGYFSDDEDRLLLDRFWHALVPGGVFVLDTRNRDQCVRSLPPEERIRMEDWTLRIENRSDPASSRWTARWWRTGADADESQPGAWSARAKSGSTRPTSCGPCCGPNAGAAWTSMAGSTARRSPSMPAAWC